MINFDRFTLENGMRVIIHRDISTQLAAVNLLYDVGARDEDPDKTGFAHLFEHLMFEGSKNIPNYDHAVERVGGYNNAFTTNDITNYYLTLPFHNIETGFWLESDRMLSLGFSEKKLDIQKQVVMEEFRQRYLNQPYGDVWLLLRSLAYKVHPYRWPTIGSKIEHIEQVSLHNIKEFFYKYYSPNNAIMVVSGNVKAKQIKSYTEKWFAEIPYREKPERIIPEEPPQKNKRTLKVYRNVPLNAIYMAFHICARKEEEFYAFDLISDLLSSGKSSRLYQELVSRKGLFSELNAYLTGSLDKGLFVFSGQLVQGVDMKAAEAAIWEQIDQLQQTLVNAKELEKVKHKVEASQVFGEMSILTKAMNLAFFELLGNAAAINDEIKKYQSVSSEKIQQLAVAALRENNCSVLYYYGSN